MKSLSVIASAVQAAGILAVAAGVGLIVLWAGIVTLGAGMILFGVALELGNERSGRS